MKRFWLSAVITALALSPVVAFASSQMVDMETVSNLTSEQVKIAFPDKYKEWPAPAPVVAKTATKSQSNPRVVRYRIISWGNVVASLEDFRTKVAETLNDPRGWVRANVRFEEVSSGYSVSVILSDPAHVGALSGCSSELSCTWGNQVIINDVRWREGTEPSRAAGMSTRDYQHMVVNHEMGHYLGHHKHIESCPNGGPAPIMLQQSTGMRGCDSFNAWPLDSELWVSI